MAALNAAAQDETLALAVTEAMDARQVLAGASLVARAIAMMSTVLGVFTLVLSAVGLHGVLSQVVVQRTREMGVRLALGASARQAMTRVLLDGLRPVAGGLLIGMGVGVFLRLLARVAGGLEIAATDPFAFGVVVLTMMLVALVAICLPAQRIARLDPMVALRDDG
jgi:ABC-type antimicrobial peptide transport system permease subunit